MSRDDLELVGFWFLFVGVWVAVGVAFVVHARLMDRKVERLRRFGRRTSGIVADYEYRRDQDGDPVPYPLVWSQTPDGRFVTARCAAHAGAALGATGRTSGMVPRPEQAACVPILGWQRWTDHVVDRGIQAVDPL